MAAAADRLEATFHGPDTGGMTAALLAYDGTAFVAHYDSVVECDDFGEFERIAGALLAERRCDFTAETYGGAVDVARERIASGDVYVLNLTGRVEGRPVMDPLPLFGELRQRAQGQMSAFFGGHTGVGPTLASVSPERFVRMRLIGDETHAEVHPVKGTRPRGGTLMSDAAQMRDLITDPKEHAEHIMIVDLLRNDIGRVAIPGSVRVDPLLAAETTPYCHQLVSTVHGIIGAGTPLSEVLASVFPCGSVTGAPKRAAMRIIDELEPSPRRAYCGSLVVALPGQIDSSVLIRTLEWVSPERAVWGSGCGVTHDSDPVVEWAELLLKVSPVLGGEAHIS